MMNIEELCLSIVGKKNSTLYSKPLKKLTSELYPIEMFLKSYENRSHIKSILFPGDSSNYDALLKVTLPQKVYHVLSA